MGQTTDTNKEFVDKYKVDNTILESYFKNSRNQYVKGMTFPLRIDNRQYCSPTDYQGQKPSCCGYSTAQILESLNWMRTGVIKQFDADQIYAKAKETDKQMGQGGTYPDLAMMKGLELVPNGTKNYVVKSSKSDDVNELKRALHQSMFVSINMTVTKDLYDIDARNFVYEGKGDRAGGHSMVCCGYDEESKMLIVQNHWGTIWGLKGFFLCPYDVWKRQNNIMCWYEAVEASSVKPVVKEVAAPKPEPKKPEPKKNEPKVEPPKPEPEKPIEPVAKPPATEPAKA